MEERKTVIDEFLAVHTCDFSHELAANFSH